MKLRLFLARFAEVQSAMLYALGMGWTEIGPEPSPFSIGGLIEVPWDATNRPHKLELSLIDGDGHPFSVPTPAGDQPLRFEVDFDVGRPPGVTPGRSFTVPVALNLGPLPFQPGHSYVVRAAIDGEVLEEVAFAVRPAPTPRA